MIGKVKDIIDRKSMKEFITVETTDAVKKAIDLMRDLNISQIPVTNGGGKVVGSVSEKTILNEMLVDHQNMNKDVQSLMESSFPLINLNDDCKKISSLINPDNAAVLVSDVAGNMHIITQYDLINALS